MIDRPRPQPIGTHPAFGGKRLTRNLRAVGGQRAAVFDLVILSVVFPAVALLPDYRRGSFVTALLAGLSLRNMLVGLACLGTWRMILRSVGVYGPGGWRSIAEYLLRWLIGLNCCTAVAGLVVLVLRRDADVWRFVELYWFACLMLMSAMRGVLIWSHQRMSGSRLE